VTPPVTFWYILIGKIVMAQNGIELDKNVLDSFNLSFGRSSYYFYLNRGKIPHKIFRPFADPDFWQSLMAQLKKTYMPDPDLSATVYNCKGKDYNFVREYFPEPGIMFLFDDEHLNDSVSILYDSDSDQELVNKLRTTFENYQSKYHNKKIGYLVSEKSGLSIMYGKFKPYKEDYSSFLGHEVDQFRDQIMDDLSNTDSSGLYLIHGKPGTGKTSFIKTVLTTSSRQPIYIPTNFIESLSSPSLLGQLMREPNSVLILEDADTALMKRSGDNSSAVSTLLNLTDGFMADFLSPIVICTFNTPLSDIDSALLRSGRLMGITEFKPLEINAANALSEHLGYDCSFEQPTPISDVINQKSKNTLNKKVIGF
jgi:hypothetical protein